MFAVVRPTLALVALVTLLVPRAAGAQIRATDNADPCVRATITLVDAVNSANALAGDSFRFRIADATTTPDGTQIPAGALGYGIVSYADHARRGGRGGILVLEPRMVTLADGKHVSVIGDHSRDGAATTSGSTNNAPSFLGAIPFVGYALGPYGFLHHGSDVTLPVGARMPVIVGDDLAMGTCRVPKPTETPTPPARRQPQEPSASAVPSASAGPTAFPSPSVMPSASPIARPSPSP